METSIRQNKTSQLSLSSLAWLAFGILLAGFPHWQRLPIWIPVVHLILLGARIYIPYQFKQLWSENLTLINLFRLLIMIGGVTGVYLHYGTLAGRDVGIALLVLLTALKVFESRQERDFYIIAYLGYFLVITNFFYSQTIPTAIYMFFVIIMMTACLINFNDIEQRLSLYERFKLSTSLMLQSIPLLIILFIFFPRVQGPLWGLPEDAYTGITGIDDQMTPGTISKLVQSNEVAFRVTFAGEIPKQSELYWRGPVLWHTDGRKWTQGNHRNDATPAITHQGEKIRYDVILEPTNKKWLFGLEMVSSLPEKSHLTHDYQLKFHEPIRSRKAFTLTSHTDYSLGTAATDELDTALMLPETLHLQTKQYGLELRDQYKTPEQIISATLAWLKDENFIYTLSPPLIAGDTIDDFLFNTRSGFCEHYAAAFTVLMRAAGIPARVVTGYLGGETNPLGNYLIVRQYHAHAWTEVWLEDKGWLRVDPTSVISTRVEQGIENAIPDAVLSAPLNLENSELAVRLWQQLRHTVDMLNYQWAQWILGYGPERQKLVLQKLGLANIDWKKLAFIMLVLLIIIISLFAFYIFKKTTQANEPAKIYYDIFCKKMAKIGLPKQAFEGPADYAQRLILNRQDLEKEVQAITTLYILIRYRSQNGELTKLKELIKSFSPTRQIITTE